MLAHSIPKPKNPIPKRYQRAWRALQIAAQPHTDLGPLGAMKRALADLAPKVRPATWCEYRRAGVLERLAAGREQEADELQALQQRDCSETRQCRKSRRRTVGHEEVLALIARAKEQGDQLLVCALLLAWRYGLRAAEMAGLTMVGPDLMVRSAKRTATRGSSRKIGIAAKERPVLEQWLPRLRTISTEALRMRLYRLCQEVLPRRQGITFHRIRHQVASDLKSSGIDEVSIARLLGHRSCKSTRSYGDPRRGRMQRKMPPVRSEFEPKPVASTPPSRQSTTPAPKV